MTKQETEIKAAAAHKNIYTALSCAQSEFGRVTKGATNPAFKSKYADLADVVGAVIPVLSANGICVIHYTVNDGAAMRTEFIHGETETKIACDIPLIVDRNNMQGMKSATTYAKRIGLESLSGVAPEDDDGNDAARHGPKATHRHQPAASTTVSADQFITLTDMLEQSGADVGKFLAAYNAPTLEEFPAQSFAQAKAQLERKRAQQSEQVAK